MTIATLSDKTRIFIDRDALRESMTPETLQRHLGHQNLNAEVFMMAGQVGIDCLTIELLEVATLLKELGII
jgi:hypothetical protein